MTRCTGVFLSNRISERKAAAFRDLSRGGKFPWTCDGKFKRGRVTREARKGSPAGSRRAWKSLMRSSRGPASLDDFESKQLARDNKSPAEGLKSAEATGWGFEGSYRVRGGTKSHFKCHTPRRCMSVGARIVRAAQPEVFLSVRYWIRHGRVVALLRTIDPADDNVLPLTKECVTITNVWQMTRQSKSGSWRDDEKVRWWLRHTAMSRYLMKRWKW